VDRVAERNAYRRALISFQQATRSLDEADDRLTADVRSAIRAIRSAQLQLEIARQSIRAAERQIDYAYELLKTGGAATRDIVEAQNALLIAQDQYEESNVSLQVQVLQFLKVTGTLRVDPESGSIGKSMERASPKARDGAPVGEPLGAAGPG
jgi:outer membrane protein TolC